MFLYEWDYPMSEKKMEILKTILEQLIPYWDLAEWFLLLLNEEWNDELKEKLYQNILTEIRNIKSKVQQQKIKTALKKLKERSEYSIKGDEEDAVNILNDFINNI